MSRIAASASARVWAMTTPLPAARPSALITTGSPKSPKAATAASESVKTAARAVGTPAAVMTSFAKALLPSSRAAALLGPKTRRPSASSRSVSPAQSGASGPTTVRSGRFAFAQATMAGRSSAPMGRLAARAAVPAFPGAQ